jgi:hypothetical protein
VPGGKNEHVPAPYFGRDLSDRLFIPNIYGWTELRAGQRALRFFQVDLVASDEDNLVAPARAKDAAVARPIPLPCGMNVVSDCSIER